MIRFSHITTIVREPSTRLASSLLLAFLFLLPAEPLYNVPWIVLAVLGAAHLSVCPARLRSPENRFLMVVFLCVWLPMLASLPDAVNPVESIRKTASLCVYFLASVYAVGALTRFRNLDWMMTGAAAICIFWSLDAIWQFFTGTDWFGIRYKEGDRLSGAFHTGRIGNVLASFAPIVFEAVRRAMRRWWVSPVLLAPFLMTILLSGTRTAWIALILATIGYLLLLACWSERPSAGRRRWSPAPIIATSGALVLVAALTAYTLPSIADQAWNAAKPRVESLARLWSGDREQIEIALSFRLSIWETALNMWSEHWLNGVGPRGFHYAYREFNPDTDYFLLYDGAYGAAKSPHMQLLEIAAETGSIGLAGYVVLTIALLARLRRLKRDSIVSVYPYALTLIVALFPLGGHLSFYGVLSTALIWWMVIATTSAFAAASRKQSQELPVGP